MITYNIFLPHPLSTTGLKYPLNEFGAQPFICSIIIHKNCGCKEEIEIDNLLRFLELEPQPAIDERVVVDIATGLYPREPEINILDYRNKVATNLGFQSASVAIVPQEFSIHTGKSLSGP